jgi:hypothetical protein
MRRWLAFVLFLSFGCGSPAASSDGGSDYCTRHTDCSGCLRDETEPGGACGWCPSLGACAHGTLDGPDGNQCGSADWAWKTGQCPASH